MPIYYYNFYKAIFYIIFPPFLNHGQYTPRGPVKGKKILEAPVFCRFVVGGWAEVLTPPNPLRGSYNNPNYPLLEHT